MLIKLKNKMKKKIYRQETSSWYLERVLFLIAGIFVTISAILILSGFQSLIYFILLVGVLLLVFAISGYCPMAIMLSAFGIKSKKN